MAIKFLAVTSFFALVVINPVHERFQDDLPPNEPNKTHNDTTYFARAQLPIATIAADDDPETMYPTDYLWMYLVFAYVFTGLAMYLIVTESRRIIEIRQEYLGSQSTITDRTIRLSGIPRELQSEEKIKEFIEELEIGKVESVMLCKKWQKLDKRMTQRMNVVRKLEEAWTVYLGFRRVERNLETLPIAQPVPPTANTNANEDEDEDENEHREDSQLLVNGGPHHAPYGRTRPTTRIWYGPLKLRYRIVDAIDYYEAQLHKLDQEIVVLREKQFAPTTLAFVTMDSVATCVRTPLTVIFVSMLIDH